MDERDGDEAAGPGASEPGPADSAAFQPHAPDLEGSDLDAARAEEERFQQAWAEIVADLTGGPDAEPDDSQMGDAPEPGAGSGADSPVGPGNQADAGAAGPDGGDGTNQGLAKLFSRLSEARGEDPGRSSGPDSDPEPEQWTDEEHFTPPEPPELPEGTPISRLAWAGTLGGPATLIVSALIGYDLPRVVVAGAAVAFMAGFVTLVWRMPDSRSDGWDDGAVL